MPSQPADAALARHTCPSNATAHLGVILLQVKKSRCTTKEVVAAQEEKVAQAAAQAVVTKAGAKRIAGIELEMDAKQANTLTRKAKGVRPHPIPKKAVKDTLSQAAACGGGDEVGTNLNQGPEVLTHMTNALMDLDNDQDACGELGTFKKKITKASMKDAVNQAHEQIKQTTAADHGDSKVACVHKKGNSLNVIV